MGKRYFFNKWYWENWTATCRKMNWTTFLQTKINSNWIKDLNIRPEIINLPQENRGINLWTAILVVFSVLVSSGKDKKGKYKQS